MSNFKIETNVPLPRSIASSRKYPFRDMKIGDSILVNDKAEAVTVAAAATNFAANQNPKWKFTRRSSEQGVRIWRIE